MLKIVPCSISEAQRYVKVHHRHHKPPVSGLFALAVAADELVVGVAIVGRPVARRSDDGWTAEVTRVATNGTPNACSMLYGASWRAAKALGYQRLITYTLETEPGSSLKGAGWTCLGLRGGGTWSRTDRPRIDAHPLGQKQLWIAAELAPEASTTS